MHGFLNMNCTELHFLLFPYYIIKFSILNLWTDGPIIFVLRLIQNEKIKSLDSPTWKLNLSPKKKQKDQQTQEIMLVMGASILILSSHTCDRALSRTTFWGDTEPNNTQYTPLGFQQQQEQD